MKWQEQFPEEPIVQKGYYDFWYQETEEEEMCKLCQSLPAVKKGLCAYCYKLLKSRKAQKKNVCKECGFTSAVVDGICKDCNPPDFSKFYEIGGPSNWPVSLDTSENFYWQPPSTAESVGSCEGAIGSSDDN